MKSIPTAVASGFLAMIFLRLLLDDRDYWGPERKREQEYVFIVSFFVTLLIRLTYSNAVTMVATGLGMQLSLLRPPGEKSDPRFLSSLIFAGNLVVLEPLLGVGVSTLIYFREKAGNRLFWAWTGLVAGGMLLVYYGERPDITAIYMLFYYITGILAPHFHQPQARHLVRKGIYAILPVMLFIVFFLNRYVYHGFGLQQELFRAGPDFLPVVTLTFDDGPDPRYTPAILDILQAKEIPATFFMVGKHVRAYPEVARRIVEEGHVIGNHTYSHSNLLGGSRAKILKEICEGQRIIEEITGEKPRYFRPPRGLYNQAALEIASDEKLTLILWSISSQDWAGIGWKDIVSNILRQVQPGDVLLFHDSGDLISAEGGNRINTVRALPLIIDGLREKGYQFVSLTDMLILSGMVGEEKAP